MLADRMRISGSKDKSVLVAVGYTGSGTQSALLYSSDGRTWEQKNYVDSSIGWSIYYNGTVWLAGFTFNLFYSYDLETWTEVNVSIHPNDHIEGIYWGNGRWFLTCRGGSLWTTTDIEGQTGWVLVTTPTTENLFSACWTGTHFIVVGNNNYMMYSTTGTSWVTTSRVPDLASQKIIWTGEILIRIGGGVDKIAATYDSRGLDWTGALKYPTVKPTFYMGVFNTIASNGEIYVVGDSGGAVAYSSDLVNWSGGGRITDVSTNRIRKITWNGKMFIAVTSNGWILSSSDGNIWNVEQIFEGYSINDVFSFPAYNIFPL